MKARLDSLPGAVAEPGPAAGVSLYKIRGKLFAILEERRESVILKSDPDLVPVLLEQYAGVSQRSHLDRRFWVCVSLDADVPANELARLVDRSYALVRANLTRKQEAELAAS